MVALLFLFLGYFLKSLIVGRVRGLWSDTAVCLEILHVSFMSSMHMVRHTRLPRITAISLGARLLNISEVKKATYWEQSRDEYHIFYVTARSVEQSWRTFSKKVSYPRYVL